MNFQQIWVSLLSQIEIVIRYDVIFSRWIYIRFVFCDIHVVIGSKYWNASSVKWLISMLAVFVNHTASWFVTQNKLLWGFDVVFFSSQNQNVNGKLFQQNNKKKQICNKFLIFIMKKYFLDSSTLGIRSVHQILGKKNQTTLNLFFEWPIIIYENVDVRLFDGDSRWSNDTGVFFTNFSNYA